MNNDFLSKLLQLQDNRPPVPLMDPNAENEPTQEDFSPAEELPAMPKPDLAKRQQILDQYKSFRTPAAVEEKPKDEDELDQFLNKMDTNDTSRLDGEMKSSDFDQSAMTGLPDASTSPSSQARVLSDFQRLKQAQEANQNNLSNLAMLQGGNTIAQGFALGRGAKIGDNSEGIKALAAASAQAPKDIDDQIKLGGTDMNDPNSDVSKFTRAQAYAILKKIAPNEDYSGKLEQMSAQQLSKLPGMKSALGSVGKDPRADWIATDRVLPNGHPVKFNKQTGVYHDGITGDPVGADESAVRDIARKDQMTGNYGYVSRNGGMQVMPTSFAGVEVKPKTDTEGKPQEVKLSEIKKAAPAVADDFTKLQSKWNDDVKESREVATSVTTLANKLAGGDTKGVDSGMLGGIQTQAAKMAGQKGVLTDQDLVKFAGAGGWEAASKRAISNASQGKISKEDIEFFKTFKDKMSKSLETDINNRSQLYTEQGRQLLETVAPGVQDSDVQKMLGVSKVAPVVQDKSAGLAPVAKGMVRFQDSTGRIHDIPEKNLEAAKLRDPGLKVMK